MTTRRNFIESLGGKCRNWRWSWAFVNHDRRWVIFGAWTDREEGKRQLILSDDWSVRRGRANPAYSEGIEYLNLVQSRGYTLFTFRMVRAKKTGTERTPASIKEFTGSLTQRRLERVGREYWAIETDFQIPNEAVSSEESNFQEGAVETVVVNRYERSAAARALCLAAHGFCCVCCGDTLSNRYGEIARNFIHVHHKIRVSDMQGAYTVDPIRELVPVCPNCHAIIHLRDPMFAIEEVRALLATASAAPQ
ncbi:HNH endonuclease [Paracoccus sanguinis]|uniref:HNH endonuclease n=1 Tax=Paracoccus sanguinis TaxID=1545044 RepID=UPI0009DE9FB7|nr:HNH endonuclease [Paracoccus sanguinis]